MSRENVEIVRRIYDAVARQDADAVLSLYDPEVEWDFSRSPFVSVINQSVYRGVEGIRRFNRERHEEALAEVADELDELIDAGDRVVSVVTSHGRGRASGAEIDKTHAAVWTFRDGRVARVVWLPSRAEALEAVGLAD